MAKIQTCKCGAKYNVEKFAPGSKIRCKKCGAVLVVGEGEKPEPKKPAAPAPKAPRRRPVPPEAPPERPPRRRSAPPEGAPERPPRRRPVPPEAPPERPSRRPARPRPDEEPPERPPAAKRRPPRREPPRPRATEPEKPEPLTRRPRRPTPAPERPARRETPPPPPPPPEPEIEVAEIPEEVFVRKEDFAAKRREVLASAPGFFGAALVLNVVVFLACTAGAVFALSMMSGTVTSDAARNFIEDYKHTAAGIDKVLNLRLADAKKLGKVDQETVYRGVAGKFSYAARKAIRGTVTVIADIDVFQRGRPNRIEYYGSGFIFKPERALKVDGYVLTCYENIAGARSVRVMLNDNSVYDARVIGYDVPANLAVLLLNQDQVKARKPDLVALEWGDSDKAKKNVAQFVLSVGSPIGRVGSVASGIISCPDRYTTYTIRTGEVCGFYNQFFQTDAPINWGSTGGPLVDLDGKVVGVCVAGLHRAFHLTDYEGLFFAIQGNFARKIANILERHRKVTRAYTGILVDSLKSLELDPSIKGVAVVGVDPDSPASSTDLKPGELIYAVKYKENGKEKKISINCRHKPDLAIVYDLLASLPVGQKVTFYVSDMMGDNKRKVELTTEKIPESASLVVNAERWGLVVAPLDNLERQAYGLPEGVGVKVIAVMEGSPAEKAGMFAGNVIVAVEGRQIKDIRSFRDRYDNLSAARKRVLDIEVRRNRLGGRLGSFADDVLKMVVDYD